MTTINFNCATTGKSFSIDYDLNPSCYAQATDLCCQMNAEEEGSSWDWTEDKRAWVFENDGQRYSPTTIEPEATSIGRWHEFSSMGEAEVYYETGIHITFEDIKNLMRDKYELYDVDYRTSFNDHVEEAEKALDQRDMQPIYDEIGSWFDDDFSGMEYAQNELKETIRDEWEFESGEEEFVFDQFEDQIRDEIYNRDESNYIKDVLKNTSAVPVKIQLHSNYDCINSHWFESQSPFEYQESYLGAIIDAMNLNPKNVKEYFIKKGYQCAGKWPNKKNRNGKEYISIEDLHYEFLNSCCGGNLFTLLGRWEISMNDDGFTTVTIPKGNPFGFYSNGEGGGSTFEKTLLTPITINLDKTGKTKYDCWSISTACNGYYDIKSCYGVSDDFFGSEIELSK